MTNKTKVLKVDPRGGDWAAVEEAARLLGEGGLVAFPTETVYGVAANLLHRGAMDRLTRLKERSAQKHFSIHVAAKADVEKYAVDVVPRAYKVIDRFWPGPLTVVLPAPQEKSVGLRMPSHEVALALLSEVDFPVVAPSANRAGRPAPRDAAGVVEELDGLVDLVLDAGRTSLGTESTVMDCRRLPFAVLREGALKKEEVKKVADAKTVLFVCTGNSCRSVMAEYLLRKKMTAMGREDVEVLSAGTFALFGMGPTRETLRLIAQTAGLDASGHKALKVTPDLLKAADLIFAMERRHLEEVLRLCPSVKERAHLLLAYAGLDGAGADIADPIGKSEEFYRMSFLRIEEAVQKIGEKL